MPGVRRERSGDGWAVGGGIGRQVEGAGAKRGVHGGAGRPTSCPAQRCHHAFTKVISPAHKPRQPQAHRTWHAPATTASPKLHDGLGMVRLGVQLPAGVGAACTRQRSVTAACRGVGLPSTHAAAGQTTASWRGAHAGTAAAAQPALPQARAPLGTHRARHPQHPPVAAWCSGNKMANHTRNCGMCVAGPASAISRSAAGAGAAGGGGGGEGGGAC